MNSVFTVEQVKAMKEQVFLFKQGSYLYIEGDEDSSKIYIIRKGVIRLECNNRWMKDITRNLGDGDIVGFTSALCDRPRTESAVAMIDSHIVVINKQDFLKRVLGNPTLAVRIINYFAQQLRDYDDMIFIGKNYNEKQLPFSAKLLQDTKFYDKVGLASAAYYMGNALVKYYPHSSEATEAVGIVQRIKASAQPIHVAATQNGIYRNYDDKQVIFCENEPGDELFIVKSGRVKIVRQRDGMELVISVLNQGEIFGELAILSSKPRNASAISIGKSTVLPINQAALLKLVEKSPIILKKIFTAISSRVWFTHIRLDTTTYKKQITKIYALLRNKLMEERVSLQSTDPHLFSFGFNELKSMVDMTPGNDSIIDDDILSDPNLRIQMGQVVVLKPKLLASKARYYISRDGIKGLGEGSEKVNERLIQQEAQDIPAADVGELFSDDETIAEQNFDFSEPDYSIKSPDANNESDAYEKESANSELLSEFNNFDDFSELE